MYNMQFKLVPFILPCIILLYVLRAAAFFRLEVMLPAKSSASLKQMSFFGIRAQNTHKTKILSRQIALTPISITW